jgi:lycopene beta-cyclase
VGESGGRGHLDPSAGAQNDVFEIAIIGAGVSGLTLAWLLCEEPDTDRRILLVDGARDDDQLRALSFWSAGPAVLDSLVRHDWTTLRLHVNGDGLDVPLHEHRYRTLFFADLQAAVKSRLAIRPGCTVVDGRVDAVHQDAEGATLTVGARQIRARWVLDSRFHLRDLVVEQSRFHLLRQFFHGWIVRTPRPTFDPTVATLLDFTVRTAIGTGFCYVLPFSASRALVELVTLQPVDAEPIIREYLARTYGATDVEFEDHESGISPLTEQPFAWRDGPRVRRIGIAAGRIKPSTGYALTRIITDAERIVACLDQFGHPFAEPEDSPVHRFLDGILLEVWQTRPAAIPPIFGAMFRRNPADRVLRFLDERASAADVARLILTLPKTPFLRAATRLIVRRALGRARLVARRHRGRSTAP